ncbi:MAG: hypothetical protein ACUZ8E_09220 [Candidatus Anammoxibacter sp.]
MHYIEIEMWGKIALFVMIILGALGVVFHAWLCSRLAFFNFETSNPSNKKGVRRIVVPWIVVGVLSAIIPLVIGFINPALSIVSLDDKYITFIRIPWKFIMPVVDIRVSIGTCFIIGSLSYYIWGFASFLVCKLAFRG